MRLSRRAVKVAAAAGAVACGVMTAALFRKYYRSDVDSQSLEQFVMPHTNKLVLIKRNGTEINLFAIHNN